MSSQIECYIEGHPIDPKLVMWRTLNFGQAVEGRAERKYLVRVDRGYFFEFISPIFERFAIDQINDELHDFGDWPELDLLIKERATNAVQFANAHPKEFGIIVTEWLGQELLDELFGCTVEESFGRKFVINTICPLTVGSVVEFSGTGYP